MSTDLESSLREAFRQGADTLAPTVDPWTRTTTAVRRSQVRRRTTALAVAAAVAAVGIVSTTTGGLPLLRADQGQPALDRRPGDVVVTTDDVTAWPARGTLLGDVGFMTSARKTLELQGTLTRLLYAGPLGAERVAVGLVTVPGAGTVEGQSGTRLFAVVEPQPGAAAPWENLGEPDPGQGLVTLALQGDDASTDLLVLARTDATTVAVSDAPEYDAKGRASRTYERLAVRDGVATTRLEGVGWPGISVLADNADGTGVTSGVNLVRSRVRTPDVDGATLRAVADDPRCSGRMDALDVRNAVSGVAANRTPLAAPRSVVPLWCRDVEGGRVGMFAVTLQDGSAFRADLLVGEAADSTSIANGPGLPVPVDAAATMPAVLLDIPSGSITDGSRWFVNAPGVERLRARSADGSVVVALPARPDADGFAEVRLSRADSERLFAAGADDPVLVLVGEGGKEVGTVPLHQDDDYFAVGLRGPVR